MPATGYSICRVNRTMGFVLSILYLVINYLTPATLFGPLAPFHIEVILAVLITLVSLPALMKSYIFKTSQSLALIGLGIAASFSVLIAMRWPGGAVHAALEFIPNAFAYFLICLHCNSKKKLQVVVLMLFSVCLFVTVRGSIDLLRGIPASGPPISAATGAFDKEGWNADHPYILAMTSGPNGWLYRLRGLGLINDPNDFGQLTVCVIPMMFIFWKAKKNIRNLAFVLLPVSVMLLGIYLTHSRGALLALMAVVVVAARRRVGTVPALLGAGVLFVAAMALNVTGGREISAGSGADRTSLWGQGLQILREHPLFGVGLNNMPEFTDVHLTAHNSLVVCAAELGLFGLYFWSLFLFSTVRDAVAVASPANVSEGVPIVPDEGLYAQATSKVEEIDKAEINRLGRLMVLSLTGFLVAAWFLSRAFVLTFFLLGGMTEVIFELALERGMIAPRLPLARTMPYSGGLAISLLLLMYISLRILNLMR